MNLPSRKRSRIAADLVRTVTRQRRAGSTQVRALVFQTPDHAGAIESALDPRILSWDELHVDSASLLAVNAFACALDGVGILAATFALAHDDGRDLLGAPEFHTTAPLPKELLARWPEQERDNVSLSVLTVARPATHLHSRVIDEFLIGLPTPEDHGSDHHVRASTLDAALAVSQAADRHGIYYTFLAAPVSPPARLDQPRHVTGPYLRVGVSEEASADGIIQLGTALIEACLQQGHGLWQRNRAHPDTSFDYWKPLIPVTEHDPDPDAVHRSTEHAVTTVTCIGPFEPRATTRVLTLLQQAKAPVNGIAVRTLGGLTIINLVAHLPDQTSSGEDWANLTADVALPRLLSLPADEPNDTPLNRYRLIVSRFDQHPSASRSHALWLSWRTPADPDTVRTSIQAARQAFVRQGATQPPNVEYLTSQAIPAMQQRGHMKISVNLNDIESLYDDNDQLSPELVSQFCHDVEQRWRQNMAFLFGTHRLDANVVWRESWGYRWSAIHRRTGQ